MRQFVQIRVTKYWETNDRTTFYVEMTTDEGFSMTPNSFRTSSKHERAEGTPGISVDEARDRALTQAGVYADLLEMQVDRYEEDGVVYAPARPMTPYTTRRVLKQRAAARRAANPEAE